VVGYPWWGVRVLIERWRAVPVCGSSRGGRGRGSAGVQTVGEFGSRLRVIAAAASRSCRYGERCPSRPVERGPGVGYVSKDIPTGLYD
jgi:hypothetical protein